MKVEWTGVHRHGEHGFRVDLFKEWDDYDYLFNIKAFGRDYGWGIYK